MQNDIDLRNEKSRIASGLEAIPLVSKDVGRCIICTYYFNLFSSLIWNKLYFQCRIHGRCEALQECQARVPRSVLKPADVRLTDP